MNKGDVLRFSAGAASALLLAAAGMFIWSSRAQQEGPAVPGAPSPQAAAETGLDSGTPGTPPAADERTREQRRFDRADRNRDGRITLAELTYPRQRAFARLDTNHDGRLSFEEWAVRTLTKFSGADANHDGALTREEFATTAPHRRSAARQARCNCAQQAPAHADEEGEGDNESN